MNTVPPIDILDSLIAPDRDRGMPLYVQVRSAMRQVIDEHFEDGQQFWTEQALVNRLSVSQITVRRALNDLAKDGFLFRRAAKGTFVRKQTRALLSHYRVGIFLPKYNSDILTHLMEGFAQVCQERGRRMDTFFTHKGQAALETFRALEHGPDKQRIVLLGNPRNATIDLLNALGESGYRSVTVDTTIASGAADYVGMDDACGIDIALEHLLGLGHRRITLLVNEPQDADSVIIRRQAFQRAMETQGFDGRVVLCGTRFWDDTHEAAYRTMPEVWEQSPRPTAILTVSDAGGWAVLKWLAERAINVPGEVSVMGFDDDRLSRFTHPSLTTLGRDAKEMAKQSLDLLDKPVQSRIAMLLPPYLIQRQSTANPKE